MSDLPRPPYFRLIDREDYLTNYLADKMGTRSDTGLSVQEWQEWRALARFALDGIAEYQASLGIKE